MFEGISINIKYAISADYFEYYSVSARIFSKNSDSFSHTYFVIC